MKRTVFAQLALLLLASGIVGCGSSAPNVISESISDQSQVTLEVDNSEQSETTVAGGEQIELEQNDFSRLFEASEVGEEKFLLPNEGLLAEGEYIELLGEQDFSVDRRFIGTIQVPGSINGVLRSTDANNPFRDGAFNNIVNLSGQRVGQRIQIDLASNQFDTFLQLFEFRNGQSRLIASNDDISSSNRNSRIVFTTQTGSGYQIRVTSFSARATGAYTLSTRILGATTPTLPTTSPGNIGVRQVQAVDYTFSTSSLRFRVSGTTGGCFPRLLGSSRSGTTISARLTTSPPSGFVCTAAVLDYNEVFTVNAPNLFRGVIYRLDVTVDNSRRSTLFSIR